MDSEQNLRAQGYGDSRTDGSQGATYGAAATASSVDTNMITYGANWTAVNDLIEKIRLEVIEEATTALGQYQELEAILKANWQGEACRRFIVQFENAALSVTRQLNIASVDIQNKMKSLYNSYQKQDQQLLEEININLEG